jgi:Protein of unknown function (DUF998)
MNPLECDALTAATLRLGVAIPVLYFAVQLLAMPFFAGYDPLSMPASLLGSDRSSLPAVFNLGAVALGMATVLVAFAFLRVSPALNVSPGLVWLLATAVLGSGLGSLWAGYFPLPDSRHGANPFGAAMFALPVLVAIAFWPQGQFRPALIAPLVIMLALVPLMGGATGLNLAAYGGLLQRVFALTVFFPLGLGAYLLMSRC